MPLLGSNNDLSVQISTSADTAGIKQAQEGIQSLNQTAEESSGKVGGLSNIFSDFGSTIKTVGEAFIAYQLVNQVEQFAGSIVSSAGEIEQTNIAFQAMIGNVQEANSVFAQLVQYANTTPFQAQDIEGAARTLMAFGTNGQQTVDMIKQLGDVASVGGANIGDLARISGQIFSAGKFDAREFLELIRDGGAGIVKVMADSVGGMATLRAEMDKGHVSSQVFFDALNKAVGQGGFAFQGAEREAQTFNGRLSTLKDAATMAGLSLLGIKLDPQLGMQVQPGGLFDQMKGGIAGLTNGLNSLQPKLESFMPQFIERIHQLWDRVANYLGPSFKDLWNTLTTQLMPALGTFWHQIIEPLLPLLGELLVFDLKVIIVSLTDLAKAISVILDVISGIPDAFRTAVDAVQRFGDDIVKAWDGFTKSIGDVINSIGDGWKRLMDTLKSAWDKAVKGVTDALTYFRDHFFEIIGFVIAFVLTLPLKIIAAFVVLDIQLIALVGKTFIAVYQTIYSWMSAALDWIAHINWGQVFHNVVTAIGDAMGAVWNTVTGTFGAIINWVTHINWGNVFRGILTAIGDVASGIWNAIKHVFDSVMGLNWGGILVNIGRGLANAIIDLINGAISGAFAGVPVLKDHVPHIAHFATGVTNYRGNGLALVGENGPELVALPRGASVYTNAQSQAMMRQGVTNNKTVTIQQVILATPAAASRFFQELDQDTINISRGLTMNRGLAA